jgi:hypothetical protein
MPCLGKATIRQSRAACRNACESRLIALSAGVGPHMACPTQSGQTVWDGVGPCTCPACRGSCSSTCPAPTVPSRTTYPIQRCVPHSGDSPARCLLACSFLLCGLALYVLAASAGTRFRKGNTTNDTFEFIPGKNPLPAYNVPPPFHAGIRYVATCDPSILAHKTYHQLMAARHFR